MFHVLVFSPCPNPTGGLLKSPNRGLRRLPGHPLGDTLTDTSCRWTSFMPVTAVVPKVQDGSHNLSHECIPFTRQALARSGLHLGFQQPSGLVASRRVCCALTLALKPNSYTGRVTYAIIQTHSQSHGAQRPQSHVVSCSGTQTGTHTGSHTSAQSHMATRSHMGPHRLMLLQVILALPPHTAGTPVPLACMLTVVLELGHPYTKSLP